MIIGKASFINLHKYLSFVELANEFNLLFVFMYIYITMFRIGHRSTLGPFSQVMFDDRGAKMGLDAVVCDQNQVTVSGTETKA